MNFWPTKENEFVTIPGKLTVTQVPLHLGRGVGFQAHTLNFLHLCKTSKEIFIKNGQLKKVHLSFSLLAKYHHSFSGYRNLSKPVDFITTSK